MNKFIQKQLSQCKVADIPKFNPNDLSMIIPKAGTVKEFKFEENKTYIIEIADYIIHESNSFNLSSTWNNGIIPTEHFLKISPTQFRGKMMQVDAVGTDYNGDTATNVYFGLWLPLKGVKIIREI